MDPRMMQQLGGQENLMTMMKEMNKMDLKDEHQVTEDEAEGGTADDAGGQQGQDQCAGDVLHDEFSCVS